MDLIKQILLKGKGRPAALFILIWSVMMNILTELPPSWPALNQPLKLITEYFGAPFASGRDLLFDGYQKKHPRHALSQPVTIVAIDEKSLQDYGQWPWPRYRLAELINAIAAHQPAAIGLDIYMPELDQTSPAQVAKGLPANHQHLADQLSRLTSHETLLAQALQLSPSVLSAAGFDYPAFTTRAGMRTWPVSLSGGESLPNFSRHFEQVLASVPQLQAAASGQALVSVDLENGVVRHVPLVMGLADQTVPTLALEMLRVASGSASVRVQLSSRGVDAVEVADLTVPTLPKGDIRLHFAKHGSMLSRYVSASDVIKGKMDPQMLAGKLVLLGLTGAGLNDMRTTAIGETVPGIEIQAQVIESVFDGHILVRPYWFKWAETMALILVGSLLVWYVPRTNSWLATYLRKVPKSSLWLTLATNSLIVWLGYQLFLKTSALFDAASFFLIISAVMGSLVSTVLVEMEKLKKSHEESGPETPLQGIDASEVRPDVISLADNHCNHTPSSEPGIRA